MVKKNIKTLLGLILGLVSFSCENLPELDPGICGNWVIEGDESCDLPDPPDDDDERSEFRCGLPSGPPEQACHFVCGNDENICPGGWSCDALTRTCRYPTGQLSLEAGPTGPPARSAIELVDLFGNSRPQLIESDNVQVSLREGLLGGGLGSRIAIPSPGLTAPVAVGVLGDSDEDDETKLALATSSGVLVYEIDSQGRALGELFPASSIIPDEAYRVELFELPAPCAGAGILSYQKSGLDTRVCVGAAGIEGEQCVALSSELNTEPAESLEQEFVLTEKLFPNQGDALVLGRSNGRFIDIFQVQIVGQGSCFDIDSYGLERLQTIELANDVGLGRPPVVGDMNGDGAIDIVLPVDTSSTSGPGWQIALQDPETKSFGEPLFDDREVTLEGCPIELPSTRDVLSAELRLLSVGDYNGDQIADIASEQGVLLAREEYAPRLSGGLCLVFEPTANQTYQSNLSLDINRDGILDLVETYKDTSILGISISNGAGLFSRTLVDLETVAEDIEAGDFDADGFKDLVILGDDGEIMVWAGGSDISTTVQTIGKAPESTYLSVGFFNVLGYEPDARSDVLVVAPSTSARPKVFPLFGTASRFLISPFRPEPARSRSDAPMFTTLPAGIALGWFGELGSGLLAVYLDTSASFIPYQSDPQSANLDVEEVTTLVWPESLRPLTPQSGIQMIEVNDQWMVFRPQDRSEGESGDTHLGAIDLRGGVTTPEIDVCLIDPPEGYDLWDDLGPILSFHKVEIAGDSDSSNSEKDREYLLLVAPETSWVITIEVNDQNICSSRPKLVRIPPRLGQLHDATIADLRHNGRIDGDDEPQAELVAMTSQGIWLGDMEGEFADQDVPEYPGPFDSGVIRAADLDDDGLIELIWSSESQMGIHGLRTSRSPTDSN